MFDDVVWPAILLVSGILSRIPIVSLLVQVFFFPTLRRVATGQLDSHLADWPGDGPPLGRGFRFMVVGFFFSLIVRSITRPQCLFARDLTLTSWFPGHQDP
jgi:hypothetical protein